MKYLKLYEYWTTDTSYPIKNADNDQKIDKEDYKKRKEDIRLFNEIIGEIKVIKYNDILEFEDERRLKLDMSGDYHITIMNYNVTSLKLETKTDSRNNKMETFYITIHEPPSYILESINLIFKKAKKIILERVLSKLNWFLKIDDIGEELSLGYSISLDNFSMKDFFVKINKLELTTGDRNLNSESMKIHIDENTRLKIKDLLIKISQKINKSNYDRFTNLRIKKDSGKFNL